jgi:hypothetical protein
LPPQTFTRGLIAAEDHQANVYLSNIDLLWRLGTKPFEVQASPDWPTPTDILFAGAPGQNKAS